MCSESEAVSNLLKMFRIHQDQLIIRPITIEKIKERLFWGKYEHRPHAFKNQMLQMFMNLEIIYGKNDQLLDMKERFLILWETSGLSDIKDKYARRT